VLRLTHGGRRFVWGASRLGGFVANSSPASRSLVGMHVSHCRFAAASRGTEIPLMDTTSQRWRNG
jgi:hypothetical protein